MKKDWMKTCDLCSYKMKAGEVYICYLGKTGTRMNFCMDCSQKYPDEKRRKGVKWAVVKNGEDDFESTADRRIHSKKRPRMIGTRSS